MSAFLLVGLTPSVILTYLAYAQTREALQREIKGNLEAQARTASVDVEHMLFERMQNALSWNHLDVMQDIQINDVDKRLSRFLSEVRDAYGAEYAALSCVDLNGRIVASSSPQQIGTYERAPQPWLDVELSNGTVALSAISRPAEADDATLPIRTAIDQAGSHRKIGELVLQFNWRQLRRTLDGAGSNDGGAVLLDADGHSLAESTTLRGKGLDNLALTPPWRLPSQVDSGTVDRAGGPAFDRPIVVGFTRLNGFQGFPKLGWTMLVLQPSATALAAVHVMRLSFLGLLAATLFFTALFSGFVAQRIAKPITRLTAFTRRFAHEQALPPLLPPPQRGEVGELTEAFVKTVRDLDRSRQDFLRASKLAVAGEIAATMAHEIRTPLGILLSSAQVLRQEPGISAEGRELLGYIESETERINRLMTSVLDTAKPHPPAFARSDIGAIVHACAGMLGQQAEKKQVQVEETIEEGDLVVDCDAEQVTQVILNLLLNAVQFVPLRGHIALSCRDDGDFVAVEIGDDGPGIPAAERAQIFEPFVSKRRGGLGLGLAVVRQIVGAHRGEVEVGASRWQGAQFVVRLPRYAYL